MLTKEEWRKQHPRLHGTKYNTYVRRWKEEHKEVKAPSSRLKQVHIRAAEKIKPVAEFDCSGEINPYHEDTEMLKQVKLDRPVGEVKKVGIIETILDLPQPVKTVGKFDEALMMSRTTQASLKAKAVDLCAKAQGGESGMVGEEVLNEALSLCADILEENKKILKLAEKVYETAKSEMSTKAEAAPVVPKVKTGHNKLMQAATEE